MKSSFRSIFNHSFFFGPNLYSTARSFYYALIQLSLSLVLRLTVSRPLSLSWNKAPIWALRSDLYYFQTVAGLLMWGALSDERTGPVFGIAAGPLQRSHSWVPVHGTCDHILLSQIRDFPFRRHLRLAGSRWTYSTRRHEPHTKLPSIQNSCVT
jgi:hypothetical protein